jgi:DNA-binding MarR family transcriptional regulator
LTSHGKEVVAQALPLWEQAQARIVDELGEEWQQDILEKLSALVSLVR